MTDKQTVVIGLLGTTLDTGKSAKRWERWRPSVSLGQHEELLVDRFVLLHTKRYETLARLVQSDLQSVSPETVVEPVVVEIADPWDLEEVYSALHEFAVTFQFNTEKEDYLIHITTGSHVAQICLFLLTESRYFPAKLLQTQPPLRGESGPGGYTVIDLDLAKYDAIASRLALEQQSDVSFLKSGIETRNSEFNALIEKIERVAIHSHEPLLLMGPTGAGKSQLARRVYELKKHRHQVAGGFVELNCATLRGDAAMSALFGHVRGAFTGASSDRQRLLKAADTGMLFLDEIGELGLDEQAMLLRAIEEKVFLPMGSDRTVESEFQLIAATNRDLREAVREKNFREDLFARINLWTFEMPGLRERPEDIEPNVEYELEKFSGKNGRLISFSKEARKYFLYFARSEAGIWHSNFRDLNAAIVRMSTLAPGGRIRVEEVKEEIARLTNDWRANSQAPKKKRESAQPAGPVGAPSLLEEILSEDKLSSVDLFDRAQLEKTIEVCRASDCLSDAGRVLFAASRTRKKHTNDADRLRKYLGKFGITWQDIRSVTVHGV